MSSIENRGYQYQKSYDNLANALKTAKINNIADANTVAKQVATKSGIDGINTLADLQAYANNRNISQNEGGTNEFWKQLSNIAIDAGIRIVLRISLPLKNLFYGGMLKGQTDSYTVRIAKSKMAEGIVLDSFGIDKLIKDGHDLKDDIVFQQFTTYMHVNVTKVFKNDVTQAIFATTGQFMQVYNSILETIVQNGKLLYFIIENKLLNTQVKNVINMKDEITTWNWADNDTPEKKKEAMLEILTVINKHCDQMRFPTLDYNLGYKKTDKKAIKTNISSLSELAIFCNPEFKAFYKAYLQSTMYNQQFVNLDKYKQLTSMQIDKEQPAFPVNSNDGSCPIIATCNNPVGIGKTMLNAVPAKPTSLYILASDSGIWKDRIEYKAVAKWVGGQVSISWNCMSLAGLIANRTGIEIYYGD